MRHPPLTTVHRWVKQPCDVRKDWLGTRCSAGLLMNQPSWLLTVGLFVVGALFQGCATIQARDDVLPPYPAYQLMRTPDGYATWHKRFLALNWDMLTAQDRSGRDKSPDGLRAYALAVQKALDHGAILYWAYQYDSPPNAPNKEILATIEVISPYLKMMAGRLMNLAEEAVKQGDTATGTAVAAHLLAHYPDLALGVVRQQAEGLLVRHRDQRD